MKRQQQGVGWGAGHACDSPPSDTSLSAKRLYVSSCASLLCGEVLTHGGLPVFISVLDSRLVGWLWSAAVALVRHPTVRRIRTSHVPSVRPSNRLPIDFARRILLPEFSPTTIHVTNTRRSKRKAQESKPSKPEQPPFPSKGGAQLPFKNRIQPKDTHEGYPTTSSDIARYH